MMLRIKGMVATLTRIDWLWMLIKPFAKFGAFLWNKRNEFEATKAEILRIQSNQVFLNDLFPERKVLHGPFKGMQYPSFDSVGSVLMPKLIGSYEMELHNILEFVVANRYSEIVNIGCGEGYYAIGLGLRVPTAKVHAFDSDEEARKLCRQMAEINGINDRVRINSFCSASTLKDFKFTNGLIISDCEGYEVELFNQSNLANLTSCDLLIETHDFIDINISDKIRSLFSESHAIKTIRSLDDIEKARTYFFPQTEHYDLATKKKIFSEGRPAIMEWLFLSAKTKENEK